MQKGRSAEPLNSNILKFGSSVDYKRCFLLYVPTNIKEDLLSRLNLRNSEMYLPPFIERFKKLKTRLGINDVVLSVSWVYRVYLPIGLS